MNITLTTDHEIIARLNQSVQELHAKLAPAYFQEYNFEAIRDFFKEIIYNPNFIFLLMDEDDQHLGYAWIEIKHYQANAFKKAYSSLIVHQINIVENQRNKGYGSKLMKKINDIAKTNTIDRIELDYWYENNHAKDFYAKNGFKKYREFVYNTLQ